MLTDLASTDSRVKEKDSFVLRRTDLLKFLTSEAPSPWNHGFIKLHKAGFPLRDISDGSQSPGHKLAKAILPLFSGYTGQSEHHLSSHSQLIDILRSGRFNGRFFVSHDAVELYPSIIITDALQLLEEKMANDMKWALKTDLSRNEILGLVKLLICNPYFQCELGFFQQAKGTPMGGPLSRLLADLLIENKIEAKIKADRKWKKSFNWVCLIDDTFMNWKDSEEKLEEFFTYLNTLYPPIKWTMEKEANDGRFNIFDIQLIRIGDNVETTVYRKPSASDRYLHFTSEQAWHEKAAAIHTLTLRAQNYCSNAELLQQELEHITQVFLDNGYPLSTIQWIIRMKSHSRKANTFEQVDETSVDKSKIDYARSFYAP